MMYDVEVTLDAMFHDGRFRNSSDIKGITSTIPEATDERNFLSTPLRWPQVA
jgi:hypothetical protein